MPHHFLRPYFDLDGVLVNFLQGICSHAAVNMDTLMDVWEPGRWHMDPAFQTLSGVSVDDYIADHLIHDEAFWAGLEPYAWSADLLRTVAQLEHRGMLRWHDVGFLTVASTDAVKRGKTAWLKRLHEHAKLPFHGKVIFVDKAEQKVQHGARDILLIDDRTRTVLDFQEQGFPVIAFPQRWSTHGRHPSQEDIAHVAQHIEQHALEYRISFQQRREKGYHFLASEYAKAVSYLEHVEDHARWIPGTSAVDALITACETARARAEPITPVQ